MAEPRVGFVGVGRMGANMARRLRAAGQSLGPLYDVDRDALVALATELVTVAASSPAEVARESDVVVTVVSDDAAMAAIYTDNPDGLLAAARERIFVNTATVAPALLARVAQGVAAAGGRAIEACMLGTLPQARSGQLVLLCAGDQAAFSAVQPMLAHLARSVRWFGAAGRGAQIKVLTNLVMLANTAAVAEALALAEGLGFDLALVREVIADSAGASRVLDQDGPRMHDRSYEPRLSARHAAKDVGIALALAGETGLDMPLTTATKAQYDRLVAAGLGELDKAGIAELTFRERRP